MMESPSEFGGSLIDKRPLLVCVFALFMAPIPKEIKRNKQATT